MNKTDCNCMQAVSVGGVAAEHTPVESYPALVGPTTSSEYNTIKAALIPIACWRMDGTRFTGETSFINPSIKAELKNLQVLHDQYPNAPLSIFGHVNAISPAKPQRHKLIIKPTDSIWPVKLAEICTGNANRYKELEPYNRHLMKGPGQWRDLWAGNEIYLPPNWSEEEITRAWKKGYTIQPKPGSATDAPTDDNANKTLSDRLAMAVYALLTRTTDLWEELYSQPFGNDLWGRPALQTMLDEIQQQPAQERRLQSAREGDQGTRPGLTNGANQPPPSGVTGQDEVAVYEHDPGKRQQLFLAYMDKLCGPELKLKKEHFLARGEEANGMGDYQGCGAFNPLWIASQQESAVAKLPNRRVLTLLFRPNSRVDPNQWPCPSVKVPEGMARCKQRFWSDSEQRSTRRPDEQRQYAKTWDTFACRFYDRIINRSPCELRLFERLEVRVVPNVFTRYGNVAAYIERLDGQPLPEVESVTLGGTTIPYVFWAPDGRLYFWPPPNGDEVASEGLLIEITQPFQTCEPVGYTDEKELSLASLRQQMAVLRQCCEQHYMWARQHEMSNATALSLYSTVLGDGHLRLLSALDRIEEFRPNPPVVMAFASDNTDSVDTLLNQLRSEHAPVVDEFLTTHGSYVVAAASFE